MSAVRIAPSLLACDLAHVESEVLDVVNAGADMLHFDVMDGVFVPNLTFGPILCKAVRGLAIIPLDVHLMVANPDPLIEPFVRAGANRISVHVEAVTHLHRTLARIRELGASPGVALNPSTPAGALREVWPFADFMLVMTVNPGFGGQRFISEMSDKLAALAHIRNERAPGVELAVDGGVDRETAPKVRAAGANVLIAGTAVFGARDRRAAIAALRGEET